MGNKVGGWPSWVEFSEMCKNEQFILQLDNYGEPFWDVTDCPTLYIFRNNKTNEFSASDFRFSYSKKKSHTKFLWLF
jgi:hypothetical protein